MYGQNVTQIEALKRFAADYICGTKIIAGNTVQVFNKPVASNSNEKQDPNLDKKG